MRNDYYSNSKDYINRWVISYADFVTMLLALFIVMYAMSTKDVNEISKALKQVFMAQEQLYEASKGEQTYEKPKYNYPQTTEEIQLMFPTKSVVEGMPPADESEVLYNKLKEKFQETTSLSVVKEKRGTIIRINDTMLFDEGSAIIKSGAKSTLTKIATELVELENPILIEGHTDSIPIKNEKYPSNWELSTARATNIIKYLTESKIISPKRLSAVGYGEYVPIADNSTKDGRAKNRRVDIIVLSNK